MLLPGNITCWRTRAKEVLGIIGHIFAIQESRLSKEAFRRATADSRRFGWETTFGKPCAKLKRRRFRTGTVAHRTPFSVRHGGTVILSKTGLTALKSGYASGLARSLYESSRWISQM